MKGCQTHAKRACQTRQQIKVSQKAYNDDSSKKRTMLTKVHGEGPCIHSVNAGNAIVSEPFGKRLLSRPVRVFPTIGTNDQSSNVNGAGFKVHWKSMSIFNIFVWNTIVANERVRQDENLSSITRICQGLGVSNHTRVKDHFSRRRDGGSERTSFDWTRSIS